MLHLLIALVVAVLWVALALVVLSLLWSLLVSLPLWVVGIGVRVTHDTARSLPPPRPQPRLPDWLFLGGVVVLGALVCAIWNPFWGAVALGVGAAVLYGKQNWRRVRQGAGGGCN
jgi:hypothetical protein